MSWDGRRCFYPPLTLSSPPLLIFPSSTLVSPWAVNECVSRMKGESKDKKSFLSFSFFLWTDTLKVCVLTLSLFHTHTLTPSHTHTSSCERNHVTLCNRSRFPSVPFISFLNSSYTDFTANQSTIYTRHTKFPQ